MRWFTSPAVLPVLIGLMDLPATGQCEVAKVLALDPAEAATLGFDPALSRDVLITGAISDGIEPDAAYVFRFDGTTWTQEAKLTASDGEPDDNFGACAISCEVAVVGAWSDDGAGSAYVFRFDPVSGQWPQEAKLVAPDAEAGDDFGIKVAARGDLALIAAPEAAIGGTGSVYAFRYDRTTATWAFEQKLTPAELQPGDSFGYPVSISPCGTVAIIGASGDDHAGSNSGAAYIYRHDGTEWVKEARLTSSDAAASDFFGLDAAIDHDVALISAFTPLGVGSAYVFRFDHATGGWVEEGILSPAEVEAGDWFGWSVGISGDLLAILAVHDDDAAMDAGAVYLYRRDSGAWMLEAKLTASDAGAGDWFGGGVAVEGDHLAIGAPRADEGATDAGAAYIFAGALAIDYDGNGVADVCDAQCPGDADGSGDIGFGDLLQLLSGWGACP